MRFSIREICLVIVIAALVIAWKIDHKKQYTQSVGTTHDLLNERASNKGLRIQAEQLREICRRMEEELNQVLGELNELKAENEQ